ncbi:acyl-CoA dehydrogenase family protein [Nocardioides terrigena]|uniref:acyl-CoA dehydrogenase family protein n=1 Tax=Nocardioides terrigena TaxID=424797 RepID=UPI00131F3928|nr:acyl-CoA dehydrogenase family protein [Nocardioides terrigena]
MSDAMTTSAPPVVDPAELREMRAAVHTMVAALHGDDDPRLPAVDGGARREAWRRTAEEHSLLGLHQPVEVGGQGLSSAYSILVAQAHGHHLARSPFLGSQVLAAPVLLANASTDQQRRLLSPLLAGVATATLAGADRGLLGTGVAAGTGGPLAPTAPERPILTRTADGSRLSGSAPFVCDAASVDWLLVLADVEGTDDLGVVVVQQGAPGLSTTPQDTIDTTRNRARVDLDRTLGEELGNVTVAGLRAALAESTVLLAAEAVGGARASLDSTMDYVRLRHQFDRPIGSFQTVQHRLADLHGDLEAAQACVEAAATALDRVIGSPVSDAELLADLVDAASLAKSVAADAFVLIARETVHLHGGIGFTWEHDAHLYYKRALADLSLLGHPADHRRALVASW